MCTCEWSCAHASGYVHMCSPHLLVLDGWEEEHAKHDEHPSRSQQLERPADEGEGEGEGAGEGEGEGEGEVRVRVRVRMRVRDRVRVIGLGSH